MTGISLEVATIPLVRDEVLEPLNQLVIDKAQEEQRQLLALQERAVKIFELFVKRSVGEVTSELGFGAKIRGYERSHLWTYPSFGVPITIKDVPVGAQLHVKRYEYYEVAPDAQIGPSGYKNYDSVEFYIRKDGCEPEQEPEMLFGLNKTIDRTGNVESDPFWLRAEDDNASLSERIGEAQAIFTQLEEGLTEPTQSA